MLGSRGDEVWGGVPCYFSPNGAKSGEGGVLSPPENFWIFTRKWHIVVNANALSSGLACVGVWWTGI